MATNVRNLKEPGGNEKQLAVVLGGLATVWLVAWAGLALAPVFGGEKQAIPANPIALAVSVAKGRIEVGVAEGIGIGVVAAAVAMVATVVIVMVFSRRSKKKGRAVMPAAKHMASKEDISSMSEKNARAAVNRMGLHLCAEASPGILLGREIRTGRKIYVDFETLLTQLWAARRGKTSTQVLPQILSAPGGVITSSNKRDTVDDSIAGRRAVGEVFVFDPQRIWTKEEPDWFFDPLDFIRRRAHDEWDAAATGLARLFRDDAGLSEGSRDMFSEGGQSLVAGWLLAACCEDLPVTDIVAWAGSQTDRTPVEVLRRHGWNRKADALEAQYELTSRTRSGVFGNAQQMIAALEHEVPGTWVTPAAGKRRFDADAFIKDCQTGGRPTMYLLSKEGPTSASALTLALLVTLMDAAEEYGETQPGGRLPVPLVCPLDEAANTVKWGELANKYSHYGSRSIIVTTILQSFTQGKRVWGEDSIRDMLTNSCVVYGGGIKDEKFLAELSAFIGDHEEYRVSRSSDGTWGKSSRSTSKGEKRTLSVAELQALPFGVMVVIPQKAAPMLVEAMPWWEHEFEPAIAEALKD